MSPEMTLESTLPKSRENSLQHGLSGAGVVLPEKLRVMVDRRRKAYAKLFPPADQLDRDDIDSAALGWVRFVECRSEQTYRAVIRSELAIGQWATLREADAQERARRLSHQPPRVISQLKQSLGGVLWLLQQWKLLEQALDASANGHWSPPQQDRAQNLAGVDRIFRHDDLHKIRSGTLDDRRKLITDQTAELQALLANGELERLDEAARQDTIQGTHSLHDPAHDRLQLYEQRARRLYERSIQRLAERHGDTSISRSRSGRRRSADRPRIEHWNLAIDREITETETETETEPEVESEVRTETVEAEPIETDDRFWTDDSDGPMSESARAEFVARLKDPEVQARVSDIELALIDDETRADAQAMIEADGLDIDLETALRGIFGLRRLANELQDPSAEREPDHLAQLAARHEREQADRERHQQNRNWQKQKRKHARNARKRNR